MNDKEAVDSLEDGLVAYVGLWRICEGEGEVVESKLDEKDTVFEGDEALFWVGAEVRLICGDAATGWRESSWGDDTGEVAEGANAVVAMVTTKSLCHDPNRRYHPRPGRLGDKNGRTIDTCWKNQTLLQQWVTLSLAVFRW